MKLLNKKEKNMIKNYLNGVHCMDYEIYNPAEGYYALNKVYKNYSIYKLRALEDCWKEFKKDNGVDFAICSYSSDFFTVGYLRKHPLGALDLDQLVYITPYNTYYIEITDEIRLLIELDELDD